MAKRIEFTAGQLAALRAALAVPEADPDPTANDLLAVFAAQAIVGAALARWLDLNP